MKQQVPDIVQTNVLLGKLAKAKAEMGKLIKNSKNPFLKNNYADLNAHLDVVEPALAAQGLVLTQPTGGNQLGNFVISRISDVETGEMIEASIRLPELEKMQDLGGAITYARRYTLGSLLAMKAEDDDGNSVSGVKKKTLRKVNNDDF